MMSSLRKEMPAAYYDGFHAAHDAHAPCRRSPYYPLFKRVTKCLADANVRSLVEVGCGAGLLAELIFDATAIAYTGFDFSPIAVKAAGERTKRPESFFVGDARNSASYARDLDSIACCEVLEHIEDDLDVIRLWPAGAYCVCSVPNFDYESHVRYFQNEEEVRARYENLIRIEAIYRVAKPPLRGLTGVEYLRELRWARDDPRKLLGLLGINRFNNLAGWFVFAGRRPASR